MLTAERNVELPLLLTQLVAGRAPQHVAIALEVVGLADRARHYPRQLSGGQEQRVGIARAIVTDPTLLLCDEPTGDLDRKSGDEILDLLQALNREHGKTIIMVTHDPHAAERATPHAPPRQGHAQRRRRLKFLPLVWRNLCGAGSRTVFTRAVVIVAFVLFGFLMTIRAAFSVGVELAGTDRLIMHAQGLASSMPLPVSYEARIAAVPGVDRRHARHLVRRHLPGPDELLRAAWPSTRSRSSPCTPSSVLPRGPAEGAGWPTGTGAIVGRRTADRFGWKVGDRIPLQGTIWPPKQDGAQTWEFNLVGIYDGDKPGVDTTQFFFRYDYLDENAAVRARGMVGLVRGPRRRPGPVGRDGAGASTRCSPTRRYETKTATEKALRPELREPDRRHRRDHDRDPRRPCFFTILLVAGNTMAQSVRERTSELAVLKTLGFPTASSSRWCSPSRCHRRGVGGGIGLAAGLAVRAAGGDPTGGLLPAFYLPPRDARPRRRAG